MWWTRPKTSNSEAKAPDWLTTPIEFEEERGFRVGRKTMRVVVVLAAVTGSWAAVAPIRELSLAHGQLIPASQIRPVQHLEGGIVDQILVKDGQIVQQHQPLIRMNAVLAESEHATLVVRAQNLLLLKQRVEALLSGRDFDSSTFGAVNTTSVSEHYRVYQLRLDHRTKERRLLLARIAHRHAEIASLQNETATQRKLMDILGQQFAMRRILAVGGSTSKKQLLDAEASFEQSRLQLQANEGKLAATQEALLEAEAALAESDALALKVWGEELAKTSADLAEVQESIKKHADRVERLVVRAPIHGRVQQVLQRSVGEIVRPGEVVARIVPVGDALVAEVHVKPEDIAAVKVHDRAELNVTAYDFNKYGKIQGEVTDISPTTFEREDKRTYYKVLIRFNPVRADKLAATWHLQPGMSVDAEIISGSKSLLQYLLKPMYRGVDIAFSER
jgi:adhesin transport system membrane fusion protein